MSFVTDGKVFDTNAFFAGGAGLVIQYEDTIKPIQLFALIKMLRNDISFGLPIKPLLDFNQRSLIEWYINRPHRNILKSLDYYNKLDEELADQLIYEILSKDPSLYNLSPELNIAAMLDVYTTQHMQIPVKIYHQIHDDNIIYDMKKRFRKMNIEFVSGSLKELVDQTHVNNFTYIFSNIEYVREISDYLLGSYSHVLLASDYGYNKKGTKFRYDLLELQRTHPFLRIGILSCINMGNLLQSFDVLSRDYV